MVANEQAVKGNATAAGNGVRIKTIAVPAEHGGWGFLCEPIALGLLLAPSVAGFYLALSAIGFFLARHPLTLIVLNRKRKSPRSTLAKRFTLAYLIIGAAALAAALSFSRHSFLAPLLIAAPLAIVQVAHDWTGRRRVMVSELAGAVSISSLAAAIALAGGWSSSAAFGLWAIVSARAVPSILYVRATIARMHAKPKSRLPMLIAHVVAVGAVFVLVEKGLAPSLAVFAMIVLLLRALLSFEMVKRVTAKQLGFSEIAFGAITILTIVIGQFLGF